MTTHQFHTLLSSFDYKLPPELIAKEPASPRDNARLLIYKRTTDTVASDRFSNILDYLPEGAVLVFNRTKVIPAKLTLRKITGGIVSALLLSVQPETLTVLASGTLKPGDKLIWRGRHSFNVLMRNNQEALLKPSFPIADLGALLDQFGETPLPPYLKDSPLLEDVRRSEYQTVFARDHGSVAAPTAGLHFTEDLIKRIEQSGRGVAYITLHVHLGTFAPLTEDQWKLKQLHTEYYSIEPETAAFLNASKTNGRPIIAVGTTTVRTLESASDASALIRLNGSTNLFITEEYKPHFVDGLITNFHVPRSSLLMLVSAFTGREKLFDLYGKAIDERMRFFSFGDGMMIV